MEQNSIRLTEDELSLLIERCVKELLEEAEGFSLGIAKRGLRNCQRAALETTYDINKRVQSTITAREQFLSCFANIPFVFTTDLEHSNTHIIEYKVQNIVAIRNDEVLLEGEWFDTDADEKLVKRIKVNCDTQSVMYYSPVLRSNHAQLDSNTRTRTEWDSFVRELTRLIEEYFST